MAHERSLDGGTAGPEDVPTDPAAALDALEAVWPERLPTSEALLFLNMSADRQALALRRLPIFLEHVGGRPADEDWLRRDFGMSRPFFYALVRAFRRNVSLSTIVPRAGEVALRGREDGELRSIDAVVRELVEGDGPFGPEELSRGLRARLGDRTPSAASTYALAAAALPLVHDGSRLLPKWVLERLGGGPGGFGRLLLLDQAPVERSEERFLSLVLDASTRIVLGWHAGEGGAVGIARAVSSAARAAEGGLLPLRNLRRGPAIAAALGTGAEWEGVRRALVAAFRQQPIFGAKFRLATFTRRMLGGRVSCVDLSSVSRRRDREWSDREIAYAVGSHNLSRAVVDPVLPRPRAGRPDDRTTAVDDELDLALQNASIAMSGDLS